MLKKHLFNILLNTITVFILLASLFPIGWMIYNSFKDNNEIQAGEIFPRRADNDVIFLYKDGPVSYVGSSDGGITRISEKGKAYYSLRSLSTNFLIDGDYLWIVSSDRGLVKLDKNTLKLVASYKLPITALPSVLIFKDKEFSRIVDVSVIGHLSITASDKKIWLVAESSDITSIMELDKETEVFNLIDVPSTYTFDSIKSLAYDKHSDSLWIGTDEVILKCELANKVFSRLDINNIFLPQGNQAINILSADELLVQTTTGLYLVDTKKFKVKKSYFFEGELDSSKEINIVSIVGNKFYAGTNAGLLIIDKLSGKKENIEVLFAKYKSDGSLDSSALESGAIRALYAQEGFFLAGSTRGRVIVNDSAASSVEKISTTQGHRIMFARGWRNYVDMFPSVDFGRFLKNSTIICGFSMLISMILATMTAYALVRFNFWGARLFSTSILVTQMIPAILYLIPMFMLFNMIKEQTATWHFMQQIFGPGYNGIMIKGTHIGLILIYSAWFLPFSIWILRGFFAAIPIELEEAATIDGCSNLGVFFKITLPLAIPGIIATGIYILIQAWDELMFAWMLTNENTMTIPVGIRLFVGNFQNRFDLMMAAATVATIPVLILFFVLQKHIVRGLTAGAVKG